MTDRPIASQQYWQIQLPCDRFPKSKFQFNDQVAIYGKDDQGKCYCEIGVIVGMQYEFGNRGATCSVGLDHTQALGIDHGGNNWLTCVSTLGKSFIIDGRKLKSINQLYNKRVASIKEGKAQGFWNDLLSAITEKRNRQMRDAIHKTARFIVNYCLEHRIGVIVFGWNIGQKDGSTMGKKNNQNFVQIPTGKLKNRIQQLGEAEGIQFIETEESYTSKASFLDNDFLPTFGARPESWEPSGKRVKRGQYKTSQGVLINADCNGAANIINKVATQLGINLAKVGRAALNLPKRYDLFSSLSKSYRKRCVVRILSAEATKSLESPVFQPGESSTPNL